MRPLLVIGWGNPLREDDGVGWLVAERLAAQLATEPRVTVVACQQLEPEHATLLADARRALLVDAASDHGDPPGAVRCRRLSPAAAARSATVSHAQAPAELLALAEALHGRHAETRLVTVAGARFGVGDRLSPAVARAAERLLALAPRLVARGLTRG